MFKKILLVLVALVAVFLVIVALQPADFRVTRSLIIGAPSPVVFAQVNDLHKWQAWSPWEKMDPAMKRSYEGPMTGVGASYGWAGNKDVGEGRMTITESRPNALIGIKLEFFKPFAGTNTVEFVFKPDGNRTMVAWNMSGQKNFVSKAICMFVSMDKMIGQPFEEGLANLERVSVAATK